MEIVWQEWRRARRLRKDGMRIDEMKIRKNFFKQIETKFMLKYDSIETFRFNIITFIDVFLK